MELEFLIGLLSVVATVVTSTVSLAYWLGRKFSEIDARFREVDSKFERLASEFDSRFKEVDSRLESIERKIGSLSKASSEAYRTVVDFLALKGLLERSEAEYLVKRVEGMFALLPRANPLTEEELKFVKEFLARASRNVDEVTVDEAEKAYEIGVRLFADDGDWRGYMLAMAAAYVRGYLVSREVRRKKEKTPEQRT
ncbi:hypothetical protein IG193_08455 [Infirmifilum lucidum]|uniref:Uncharacterized protein n=1 Tax=Infirmifilum lucidum TaxID=2776706 RepID=A0A7L9FIZ9_9CREN|nr:hypothetical protein [Infirmifilum lucidum]QOJ78765.1 hypothetical protein IG193_08455 [Infirmifilum lucidum]